MNKRHVVFVAFTLLAAMPIVVYATLSFPAASRGPSVAGLVVVALAAMLSSFWVWRLLRQTGRLEAELAQQRQLRADVETHCGQMYSTLERKLEERTAELAQERAILVRTEKLTALGRLAGGVAHELNNPLMAILGEAMILGERCNGSDLGRGLRVIEQQAARCASLIRDLIAFAGQEQRNVQPLDVHALLEGALAQAATVAPAPQVTVERQYCEGILAVKGNLEQLQQALSNVITNALQAMANGAAGQLTLRSRRQRGGRIGLEIADTGVGIEPELLPYIFDPFYSRPRLKTGMSVGMGLSVTLGLIQAHGGSVWAESERGQGTTIHIELPEAEPEAAPQVGGTLEDGRQAQGVKRQT